VIYRIYFLSKPEFEVTKFLLRYHILEIDFHRKFANSIKVNVNPQNLNINDERHNRKLLTATVLRRYLEDL